jgi:hypothetical protein
VGLDKNKRPLPFDGAAEDGVDFDSRESGPTSLLAQSYAWWHFIVAFEANSYGIMITLWTY